MRDCSRTKAHLLSNVSRAALVGGNVGRPKFTNDETKPEPERLVAVPSIIDGSYLVYGNGTLVGRGKQHGLKILVEAMKRVVDDRG